MTTITKRDKAYAFNDQLSERLTRLTGMPWRCFGGVWKAAEREYEVRRIRTDRYRLTHDDACGGVKSAAVHEGSLEEIASHVRRIEFCGLDVRIDSAE